MPCMQLKKEKLYKRKKDICFIYLKSNMNKLKSIKRLKEKYIYILKEIKSITFNSIKIYCNQENRKEKYIKRKDKRMLRRLWLRCRCLNLVL